MKSSQLIELLWQYDYELYWYVTPLFNENNFKSNINNIFGRIVSVNMLAVPKENQVTLSNFNKIFDSAEHPLKKK